MGRPSGTLGFVVGAVTLADAGDPAVDAETVLDGVVVTKTVLGAGVADLLLVHAVKTSAATPMTAAPRRERFTRPGLLSPRRH
jgi:hypothetical protein